MLSDLATGSRQTKPARTSSPSQYIMSSFSVHCIESALCFERSAPPCTSLEFTHHTYHITSNRHRTLHTPAFNNRAFAEKGTGWLINMSFTHRMPALCLFYPATLGLDIICVSACSSSRFCAQPCMESVNGANHILEGEEREKGWIRMRG